MKNQNSWQFAHRHFGKVWLITGLILLPVSAGWMLLLLKKTEAQISMWGLILCGVQLLVLLVSLFPTEAALRKKFDR